MKVEELRFNGCNGHSRIIKIADREIITVPLLWVSDLRIVYFPESKHEGGKSRETYQKEVIEAQGPEKALYFARSEEVNNHVGVQYYRPADEGEALDERIPVGMPAIVNVGNYRNDEEAIKKLIHMYLPKDAVDYVRTFNGAGKLVAVQFYKFR